MQLKFDRKNKSNEELLKIYRGLVFPRMIEEKMLNLLRQGKISKWFSGIGQEAISVGTVLAMQEDEYILPMHRNLGIFTGRGIPFARLFSQWQGKMNGFSKGRERSFHFGTNEYHIVGMISHLGPQMGVADGIALGQKLNNTNKVTAVFTGDGGASQGDFHESINTAAVWDLPVIFIIENNGYGLSTPSSEQFRFESFTQKGPGYGIQTKKVDGNNVLEVYDAITEIRKDIIENKRPWLLECMTFRMRGHEEASGTKYVPQELFDIWAAKDPVSNFEEYLISQEVLTSDSKESIKAELKQVINEGVNETFNEPEITANTVFEINDVFAPFEPVYTSPDGTKTMKRLVDAISDGLNLAMQKHPELILMGQDIAEYGGVFKVTENFYQKYGKDRVRNTPLCEAAILGSALGLSIVGKKAMVEMQFADFVTEGFNQIINNLAKSYYRWGQNADVVVRMPTGAGVAAGPFHSQSNEAWFTHTPGLKVVYPAFPADAKGLLLASFEDPNPVMFFEHKALYRSVSEEVPDDYYTIEIGKAKRLRTGDSLSIITYGFGVHWAIEILEKHPEIEADLIDLRTLMPLDEEAIFESVRKTGRVMVLHEDCLTGGFGAEISARIAESCFKHLDAPVMRVASLDTPVPFSSILEQNFLPKLRLEAKLLELYNY
ncbi:MAG: dehydrogenase E1 component subunit alpha/beta [Bacteroidia bacterium]